MCYWKDKCQRRLPCFFWGVFNLKQSGDSQSPGKFAEINWPFFRLWKQKKPPTLLLISAVIGIAKILCLPFSQRWWLVKVTGWVCFKCPEHWTFHTEGAFQQHASLCWLNRLDPSNHLPLVRLFSAHLLISCIKLLIHCTNCWSINYAK